MIDIRLSKSTVGMYKQCPYRYFRTKREGWKPKIMPAQLKNGIEIHDHLEYVTTGVKTIADVKKKIMKRKIKKHQAKDIVNFFDWQKKRRLPLYIEENFVNTEHNISGRVDRIDIGNDGKLVMIDYKSGKGKWKKIKNPDTGKYETVPDWKYYRFELAIYTFLFESKHNQKINKWGVFFTTINKYIEEPVIREEIQDAIAEVHRVRKEIHKSIDNNDWPKNSTYLCRWCELFQNNECDCGRGKECDQFSDCGELVI